MAYRILVFKRRDRDASFNNLFRIATELFYQRGYNATTMQEVVERAELTRGALYHHFRSKKTLFQFVALMTQQRIAKQMNEKASLEHDPIEALRLACHALLEGLSEPGPLRVLLLDGPGALGWEAWREIDRTHIWPVMQERIEAAMLAGSLANRPVDEVLPLLVGAIQEAALDVARDPNPWNRNIRMRRAVDQLVEDLRGCSEERLLQLSPTPRKDRFP